MNRDLLVSTALLSVLLWSALAGSPIACAEEPGKLDPGTAALIDLLPQLDDPQAQLDILKGIRAGLKGQRQVAPPATWNDIFRDHLAKSENAEVRDVARLLALQFGDEDVRRELLHLVGDEQAPLPRRREALATLAEIRARELPDVLHKLLSGSALRSDALGVLADFGNADTPAKIIRAYPQFTAEEKRLAIESLSTSVDAARQLLEAVAAGKIPRTDLQAEAIRRLQLLGDEEIATAISEHWGTVRQTPEAKAERIAALKKLLLAPSDREPDLPHGRAVFARTCRQCHTLYGDGEKVGPDITGSNRSDLDYLLLNVVDPNATIGRDYQAWSVMTDTGKLHVGLLVGQTDQLVTLRTETDTISIPTEEIEFREQTPVSMMPEGLLDQLTERELRDLVAYLRAPQQVPILATDKTASLFFNGRDLSAWEQTSGEWTVEDGKLRGKGKAEADVPAVLQSEFILEDFVLAMEVRLSSSQGRAALLLVPSNEQEDASQSIAVTVRPNGGNTVTKPSGEGGEQAPSPGTSDAWHSVHIERHGKHLQIHVDNEAVPNLHKMPNPPRFRPEFRTQGMVDGEFTVRDLSLSVSNPTGVD